ncbi:MAG TPA: hypothetical protein VML75_22850, partial [Kofleriaceae bacterium]|nr:hypothetical protein [Kofleriaceae bacterium]
MEQGDSQRAADLLTRQAGATEAPAERMKLFEALGDMAVMTLHDEARARACYEQAVASADPLEAKHLPLLEKLLERQDLAGDNLGAARTAELMASFGADAGARAARYTAAAESYVAAGDTIKARAASAKAVEADPYDLTAVTVLSDLLLAAGEHEQAAAVLGRALSSRKDEQNEAAPDDDLTAARRSLLWYRLAEARRARGDAKGALPAFEKAVALATDSDGAMSARRRLIEIWSEEPARLDTVLEYRRTIAADSIELEDVAAYARALREADRTDSAVSMLELAEVLGYALTEKDRKFLDAYPPRKLAADEAYRGKLDAADRAELIADASDQPLGTVLGKLWEAAPLLWSEPEDALERCMVIGAKRVPASSVLTAAAIFPRVAAALDIPATMLYATSAPDAEDVRVVCVSPPIVVLGPRFQGLDETGWSELELRFVLGRAAEMCRPERIIAMGLPPEDFTALLDSLARVFGPAGLARSKGDEASKYQDEMLRTTLPVKLRGTITKMLEHLSRADLDPDRYLAACRRAADRAGLLVCGDLTTAVKFAGEMSSDGRRLDRHLVRTALRPRYLPVRARLGLGAKS